MTRNEWQKTDDGKGKSLLHQVNAADVKVPAAVTKAARVVAESGAGKFDADAAMTAARDALAEAIRTEPGTDASGLFAGYLNGETMADQTLPPSNLATLETAVTEATRWAKAADVAHKNAWIEYSREVAGPKVLANLEALWTEIMEWAPNAQTTAFEAQRRAAESVPQLDAIARLTLTIADMTGATKGERDRLRKALAARPAVLPTLATIEAAMKSDQENTPHAKAAKRYNEDKALQQERDRASATVGAKSRNPQE